MTSPTPPPPIFIKERPAVVLLGFGSQDEIQGLGESTVYNKIWIKQRRNRRIKQLPRTFTQIGKLRAKNHGNCLKLGKHLEG